jgi:lysozyme
VTEKTVDLIKGFEGFAPTPSPDPIHLPTVGYGHLCQTKGCGEVPYKFPLTEETATELLHDDLKVSTLAIVKGMEGVLMVMSVQGFQNCVYDDIKLSVRLNDNQYGALVSWAFNVGCGNVESSTLLKRLNNGENPDQVVEEELPKWNHAGGKVEPGLTRRRAAEVQLFKTASGVIAHPAC